MNNIRFSLGAFGFMSTPWIRLSSSPFVVVSTHSNDIKTRHHGVIFMLQIVAVEHVVSRQNSGAPVLRKYYVSL
jgi:D-serine deaminase-like pyridoxal phosphate-dependent protein